MQTTHEEAVRAALGAVPSGRLAKLELAESEGAGSERNGSERDGRGQQGRPEWHSEIVSSDGARTSVTQSATGAEPATAEPAVRPDGTAGPRLRALLRKAVVTPEDAVRKVATPDYDKVDAVELAESDGRPVWRIRLVAVEPGNAHVYEIDAATGDVLGRRRL
ncbi:PepSY domain-containing protein [Streptomyces marispadix]|uniref:PepSY domain-containing protein n=1 Tax=Streptomyces marispadix TaxID=2922868 RepID=A0ABS9SVU2_9ACTN|nr:PepSY domain-containing protein [Streptomyces marispadix]MCH6160389.1 PepSY domain-containing protein [Streptomyces marispadix]